MGKSCIPHGHVGQKIIYGHDKVVQNRFHCASQKGTQFKASEF